MSSALPAESRCTHHPAFVNLEQGSRYFDFFNEFRSASPLKLRDVDENVFLFLNTTEVHVFCGMRQELWMGMIPEQIISAGL